MRFVGLWILLVAVYAATLGIPAQPGMDYAGNEPHHLLAAESLVSDRKHAQVVAQTIAAVVEAVRDRAI